MDRPRDAGAQESFGFEFEEEMTLHFFAIPALDPKAVQDELNQFCNAQRVVALERQFVAAGVNSFWSVCVSVATGSGPLPDTLKAPERRSILSKVDYKQVLSESEFARYAELRAWRKTMAERDGVPVYGVFTNEQLAEIIRRNVDSLAALGEIEGIGPSRLERYGDSVLHQLQKSREQ